MSTSPSFFLLSPPPDADGFLDDLQLVSAWEGGGSGAGSSSSESGGGRGRAALDVWFAGADLGGPLPGFWAMAAPSVFFLSPGLMILVAAGVETD